VSAPNVSRCKSQGCRAPIIWTITAATGAAMPVDEDPSPTGPFVLEERGRDLVAHHINEKGLVFNRRADRFTSHYATCPEASDWRKARVPR
jgi:hypothetical protein